MLLKLASEAIPPLALGLKFDPEGAGIEPEGGIPLGTVPLVGADIEPEGGTPLGAVALVGAGCEAAGVVAGVVVVAV